MAQDFANRICATCGSMVQLNHGQWNCACHALSAFEVMQGATPPASWQLAPDPPTEPGHIAEARRRAADTVLYTPVPEQD